MTYNDMRDANVIFIGSTWANELADKFNNRGDAPGLLRPRENREPQSPCRRTLRVSAGIRRHHQATRGKLCPVQRAARRNPRDQGDLFGRHPDVRHGCRDRVPDVGRRRFRSGPPFRPPRLGKRKLPGYFQAVMRHDVVRGEAANESLVLVREVDGKSSAAGPDVARKLGSGRLPSAPAWLTRARYRQSNSSGRRRRR